MMTKAEAIALALRVADFAKGAGWDPPVMLADTYDGREILHLDVYESGTLRHIGRLHSLAEYERLLSTAWRIAEGVSLN